MQDVIKKEETYERPESKVVILIQEQPILDGSGTGNDWGNNNPED